ncbi:hypothetical protein L0B53_18510 (plasmid) [Vibrio sp. SS-MA-C1-2]|nr:hypothetical protein [Vibrio sp. SS-MA-C1-2]UJF20318.1 hypothetical protein L0B53_18510 [Vibrio sp. SS-MA-C1-2]
MIIARLVKWIMGFGVIAHLLQIDSSCAFVEGTIIDNLTCFRPQLSQAAYSLCESFQIKQQIDRLSSGFYTPLNNQNRLPFSRQTKYTLFLVQALIQSKAGYYS